MSILALAWELESIFLVCYLAALFTYIALIYTLGYLLFGDRLVAMAGALILVIFIPFGGIDCYFHIKSLAVPLAIGVLAAVLHRKFYLEALLARICFLLHPITSFVPTA